MNTPRVSIITPTYNRAALLGETIESLLNQDFGDFEYIIVDDGSEDDTQAVIASYDDPRIQVFQQPNSGESSAINRGWANARGRYAAVISSDDPMLPNWLGEMVAALDANESAVVAYPDWQIIDDKGERVSIVRTPDYQMWEMAAKMSAQPGPGTLIRKSAGDRLAYPRMPGLRYTADFKMWLELSLLGPFVRVAKVLASWRSHGTSISVADRSLARADEFISVAYDFWAKDNLPFEVAIFRNHGLATAHRTAAWIVRETEPEEAARHEQRAAMLFPKA